MFYELSKFRLREVAQQGGMQVMEKKKHVLTTLGKLSVSPLLSSNFATKTFKSPLARRLRPLLAVLVSTGGVCVALNLREAESGKHVIKSVVLFFVECDLNFGNICPPSLPKLPKNCPKLPDSPTLRSRGPH